MRTLVAAVQSHTQLEIVAEIILTLGKAARRGEIEKERETETETLGIMEAVVIHGGMERGEDSGGGVM